MSKILIIEDQEEIRDNLQELLKMYDYSAICAADGQAGIDLINLEKPDLVLCDVAIPKMNGYEVLATLRAEPITVKTPFIFITASAQEKDIKKGRMSGADGYLTKPFETEHLIALIEQYLGKKEGV